MLAAELDDVCICWYARMEGKYCVFWLVVRLGLTDDSELLIMDERDNEQRRRRKKLIYIEKLDT